MNVLNVTELCALEIVEMIKLMLCVFYHRFSTPSAMHAIFLVLWIADIPVNMMWQVCLYFCWDGHPALSPDRVRLVSWRL